MEKKKSRKPNTKTVPSVIVLSGAAIVCVASLYQGVSFGIFVFRLLIVVVVFLIMGTIAKIVLDNSFKTMDDPTLIEQLENHDLSEDEEEVDSEESEQKE